MNSSFMMFVVIVVVVAAIILVVLRPGRMGRHGAVEASNKVEQDFKRHQLPKDYHYYYYAESPTVVYALVGLGHRYTIGSADWQTFDPEEAIVENLVANLTSDTIEPADGYVLIGLDKSPVGICYTTLPAPAIQINDQQQVAFTLELPPSSTYGE